VWHLDELEGLPAYDGLLVALQRHQLPHHVQGAKHALAQQRAEQPHGRQTQLHTLQRI
jgi:hypothetical protein